MMKKTVSLFVVSILVIIAVLSGCGAKSTQMSESKAEMAAPEAANEEVALQFNEDIDMDSNSADGSRTKVSFSEAMPAEQSKGDSGAAKEAPAAITGTGTAFDASKASILDQRKIIRNANVSVEVEDFDKAYGQINSLINGIGIIQETSIKKDPRYIKGEKVIQTSGYITIRVYADKFESVLTSISGLGDLLDQNVTSNDITDQFFDTEARLKVLKIEYDYVEEYLKQVKDLDTIFKTQKRLTELREEIERLTGTLNKWKDLVDLSTIRINITEKPPEGLNTEPEDKTYFGKLGNRFLDSSKGVIEFCGELFIFIVAALPVLVFLGIIGFIMVLLYKKLLKPVLKREKDKDQSNNINS